MAVGKPVAVPQKKIDSIDILKLDGGLFLLGAENAPQNTFVEGTNVELSSDGYLTNRRVLTPLLPDTVENGYQKFPVLWNGELFYFTADAGKIKYCQAGDAAWTDCIGTNSITTQNGGMPKFLRVLNNVLLLNGTNGDKLCYVDLETTNFPVVKYSPVTDPPAALTSTLTNLTTGAFFVYYAYTWSSTVGQTKLSPILSQSINIVRDQWTSQTSPASIKVTRPGSPPAGAKYWNLFAAIASTGGTIQDSDMLELAVQLDIATTSFVDDGTLSINLGSVPPLDNSTDGPRVDQGIVEEGNPILYSDPDNPYNIYIGGGGPNAMDFSISNGGYLAQPEQGTNYYANVVVGFRNGQGIPSLSVLYSNTEGLSKQAVLQQQTVNYGDQSFTVWGVTEQHYGAAGVAASNSAINYNGKLAFLSTDGFVFAETQASVQNILSINAIDTPVADYVSTIKNSAMNTVVGAGWNNKFMWLSPAGGFDRPQQIIELDTANKGVEGKGAWEVIDIPADWIGVISPQDDAAFPYIVQGKQTYRLLKGSSSYDVKGGSTVPFGMSARGAMTSMGGGAHNEWQATVQAVFYILELVGPITVGVTYYDDTGKPKTKTKDFVGPTYNPSPAGGWGDPGYAYADMPAIAWSQSPVIDDSLTNVTAVKKRIVVPIEGNANEAQWFYFQPVGYNHHKLKVVSYEGIPLGVRPDLA